MLELSGKEATPRARGEEEARGPLHLHGAGAGKLLFNLCKARCHEITALPTWGLGDQNAVTTGFPWFAASSIYGERRLVLQICSRLTIQYNLKSTAFKFAIMLNLIYACAAGALAFHASGTSGAGAASSPDRPITQLLSAWSPVFSPPSRSISLDQLQADHWLAKRQNVWALWLEEPAFFQSGRCLGGSPTTNPP